MAEFHFTTPISKEDVQKVKIGDVIYVSGTIFTARDEAHERALHLAGKGEKMPIDFEGLAVYHCGPVVRQVGDEWEIVAAGPTTSTRMDLFEDEFIKTFNVNVVIGKGGMGDRTAKAMKEYKAIYTAFVGGAAVVAAKGIKRVKEVHWLDLGTPECLWVLEVDKFGPLIVGIDSNGESLFKDVALKAQGKLGKIGEFLGITF
ncbi:MAG: fumarate hydratase C-terminal domain-containing protein [Candidatus Heimdallarchaeota archaeon]|nr:MAG: fumarate hydratase C-terminal domain-containing protein [Candidatus Heimdallarchaeota archaeon]